MIYPKFTFTLFLLSVILFVGCKKNTPLETIIPAMDFQVEENKVIQLGALKIYPISSNLAVVSDSLLTLEESLNEWGYLVKARMDGNGIYEMNGSNSLYFANKSNKTGIVLLGDIAQDNDRTYIFQDGVSVPSKKITDIGVFSLRYFYFESHLLDLNALFPCPPTPMRDLIHNRHSRSKEWLHEALPLLGYTVSSNIKNNTVNLNIFGGREDNQNEITGERVPQENLGNLNDFTLRFAPIAQHKTHTGCLVTYHDTVLISYVFAQADLFEREWPHISSSIYLNQLMGFHEFEMTTYTPFIDASTSSKHINQLWQKKLVLPQDNAYRGDANQTPFYLVSF